MKIHLILCMFFVVACGCGRTSNDDGKANTSENETGKESHITKEDSKKTVTPCEPFSQGCFTVGHETFDEIKKLVGKSKKPIMLYAYN